MRRRRKGTQKWEQPAKGEATSARTRCIDPMGQHRTRALLVSRWDRLHRLLVPVAIAVLVYNFLRVEFGLSRLMSMPAGLFVARQVQARFLEVA